MKQPSSRTNTDTMSASDADVIRKFAAGDKTLRDQAVAIHRKWIPTIGVRGTPEQDFMSEVDNPCPDLLLRGQYRKRLVEG